MIEKRIIAYSGAHGTGKTTAVYELAAEIKKYKHPAKEVGIILETARRCPFPVLTKTTQPTRDAQIWIFAEQIRQEMEMPLKYDVVISDRTVVDCIGYSSIMGWHDLAYAQIALARHHARVYDHVFFRGIADNPYLKDDEFRSVDKDLQVEYERRLLEIYNELGIKVIREGKEIEKNYTAP
ncbi:MAG: ATP-binding protein [Desulfosarcina sp.]|nr:ATP-binding protein [Desulfosarcina sp.]MBC2742120.1 ATP-binding protein [Desulfosarcina sp.]MBC2765033.1 ATP-binding protein [Desulfosarcina sp.]